MGSVSTLQITTYTLGGSHVASCGGVTLEAQGAGSTAKIFSVTGF
jgi:hypothetical protein